MTWYWSAMIIFALFNLTTIICILLARKYRWYVGDQRVGGLIFNVYGIVYALFLGFITFSVWERFNNVRTIVQEEGKAIVDLYRDAMVFPEFSEEHIQGKLKAYLAYVINIEWPQLGKKIKSDQGDELVFRIWSAYYNFEPQTEDDRIWYENSIEKLTEFSNARILRIYNSKGFVGVAIWTLLIVGGLVLVVTPSFFQMESLFFKMLLMLFLTNIIAFMLFIIYSFDHPFGGYAEIDNLPFKYALRLIESHTW